MRSKAFILLLISGLWLCLGSCDRKPAVARDKVQEAWDNYNNPALLDSGAVVNFDRLPSAGLALEIPWSDIYWPSQSGGIALRWQAGFEPPFGRTSPTEAEVRAMSSEEVNFLSPAEKYDIFMGRFDYPTVQAELIRTHPSMPAWYGLCHGWASAAVNFKEPGQLRVRGATGVEVTFTSSDIKALLAYAQGIVYQPFVRALGQRCDVDLVSQPHLRNSAACRDTNAGSFHLILTNLVGRSGQQIIADLSRGAEVWNFPIYGYATREIARRAPSVGAAPTTAVEVVVETAVEFIVEIESPSTEPLRDTRALASETIVYQYTVELDSYGRVVGGAWISEERPDFLWVQERSDFRGYYGNIEGLYERSIRVNTLDPVPVLTPTPTPAPTVTPTPTPEPVTTPDSDSNAGSEPIGPVLTQPIPPVQPMPQEPNAGAEPEGPTPPAISPDSGPDVDREGRCFMGQPRSLNGIAMCVEGDKALEPVTQEMVRVCLQAGLFGCQDSFWTVGLYAQLRGGSVCPLGSLWSEKFSACVEGEMVLGPFGVGFNAACRSHGFGHLCDALKMHAAYFDIVKSGH